MKIATQKRVSIIYGFMLGSFDTRACNPFVSSSGIEFEGKNSKDVISQFLNSPEAQDLWSEDKSFTFLIVQYDKGEILESFSSKTGTSETTRPIYFNQTILADHDETLELIKKNRKGYKNMERLWEEAALERTRCARANKKEQIKVKRENDIFLLAKIMRASDFKKLLKEAKTLKESWPKELKLDIIDNSCN